MVGPLPPVVDGSLTNVTGTNLAYLPDAHRTIWSLVAQDEWQIAPRLAVDGRRTL
jgi:hypothetical protein